MDLKRSWMFVPGHRQRMIDKAMGLNTDVIMLDIEDGVAPSEKDTARKLIGEALGRERLPNSPTRKVRASVCLSVMLSSCLWAALTLLIPDVASNKEPACQCKRHKRLEFDPYVGKIPWRKKWQPTAVFLPGKSHGQRSLADYSPWSCRELDTTDAT